MKWNEQSGNHGQEDQEEAPAPRKGAKKPDPWIPKERLEYIPWARYCVGHQEEMEKGREIA